MSTALIVGGGIAGLSASIALSNAGVRCDVLELAAEPLGASLGISGRAAEALEELGVYDACFANAAPFTPGSTALTQMAADGTVLSAEPVRPPAWPGAKTAMGIYRPVLLAELERHAESLGVRILRGVTTETIENGPDAAFVTLTNGERGSYDLVVGADGIGSATRAAVFPEAPKPSYAGQLSLRWMAPGPAVQPEGWYIGEVGRLGFYYLPQNLVYIPAVVDSAERVRLSDAEANALFGKLLDSYTAPAVVELRSRFTPDSEVICRPFDWIFLTAPWHRGRTLLIGDAAHATTAHLGQGGGMAMEDAVVLGQCVAKAATLDEAFAEFMSRRYERTRTVVETSVELSRLEKEGAHPEENMALIKTALLTLAQPY
ncbi:FAD-dependent monooxygenase [Actinocorallia sp. A-T 12471]|uniref:FAD-dependent monooxygenase n=1 Tax=Actinocorallia sp. A-T 12471 TaxID=3089813 RepID=UPI0029D2036F|nr:FAD-dependent monooxygenase [Actinocorallia sp. A-T 12471]MDX6740212.1 FAD-dependent monooxygenase [Actinocorallia sp. A-T 12471]